MGANSKIEWTDHTMNPWVGCTKVSAACDHCYAESLAKRTGQAGLWAGERRRTSETYWKQPLKWDKQAKAEGVRRRVFCASLADVFDNQVPVEWRGDLWALISQCQNLDWLMLTKRPQNIWNRLPLQHSLERLVKVPWPWPNVWIGTTVENQEEADRRIPHLLRVPAAARFLSCEPLLGPIDLGRFLRAGDDGDDCIYSERWVIAGGESGPGARPMHPDWARSLRDQCAAAGVPFHFKQWGSWCPRDEDGSELVPISDCAFGTSTDEWMAKVGKRAAGRLLDGVEHNGFPDTERAGGGLAGKPDFAVKGTTR